MSWVTVALRPGLNTQQTPTALEAGYTQTNYGRFKDHMFQKIGGWTRYYPNNLVGSPRHSHSWEDLANNSRYAVGTTTNLYDITNNVLKDVSPQTLTTNPAVSFTTTAGSPVISITDTAVNNITAYDSVFFNTPIAVDGLILSGLYAVTAFLSATSYQITAAANAVAGVLNGGAVPAFTTTSGSPTVKVTLASHGQTAGNDIVFPISTTVGGVTIFGRYIIQSIVDANNFNITAGTSASSTAGPTSMNGGNAQFLYYIALGPVAAGSAYGTGTYGTGTYGFGSAVTAQTGAAITSTDWTLDNWGELLTACPDGGGIYYWGPASGYLNSSIIPTGPVFNTGAFVSIAEQQIVAYGSTVNASIGVYQDPMLVRWCDVGNFAVWNGTTTNQAGQYRIPTGSKIIGGVAGPSTTNYIWTDINVYAMNYIGAKYVYGFTKIADNCGLIAKHAHAELGSSIYWMGIASFFVLSGGSVAQIPCPVWDAVYQNLDVSNKQLCFAGANTAFSEIWFYYPSLAKLGYCDMAAKYNVVEQTWDIVQIQRNTWIDASIIPNPIATTQTGAVYAHESGMDADNQPITPSFQTGYFSISNGEDIPFVDRIYPDFRWGEYGQSQNAQIQVTVYTAKYPGSTPKAYGPYLVTKSTPYISKRIRGRYFSLAISSSDSGSFWRLGAVKVRWAPDGRGL